MSQETAAASTAAPAWRRWVALVLVILSSLAGFGAVLAVSSRSLIFDTDRFMATVGPTLEDPAFYEVLADFAADEAMTALDIENRLTTALTELDELLAAAVVEAIDPSDRLLELLQQLDRPTLAGLAPALAAPVEERIRTRVHDTVTSDLVEGAVPVIVRQAHTGLLALLNGDMETVPNIYVADGEVNLNLLPLIARGLRGVAEELTSVIGPIDLPDRVSERADEAIAEFRQALGESVPDSFGQLTLMTESQLDGLQNGWHRLSRLVWVWGAFTLVLMAVALAVSPHKRRTSIQLALGLVIVLVLGALAVSRIEATIAESLGVTDGGALVVGLLSDAFSRIRFVMWLVIVLGLLAAAGVFSIDREPEKQPEPAPE